MHFGRFLLYKCRDTHGFSGSDELSDGHTVVVVAACTQRVFVSLLISKMSSSSDQVKISSEDPRFRFKAPKRATYTHFSLSSPICVGFILLP
jgi:hypothetical protein